MKFLYDFFPILLFFFVYKFYSAIPPSLIQGISTLPLLSLEAGNAAQAIYLATAVAIAASFVQVSLYWLRYRRFQKAHLISFVLITIFGGATLVLRDPLFIKWKPTILNWLFALVFLGSQFLGDKTIVERMMGHAVSAPQLIWRRLNMGWVGFFLGVGVANIYVAYTFSEAIWVEFKLFGLLGMTLVFVLGQALYLARYMEPDGRET